eukprot:1143682-Pelagomonas_calceolata.AAC.2
MQRSLPAGEERRQRPWARLGTMSALLLQAQLFGVKEWARRAAILLITGPPSLAQSLSFEGECEQQSWAQLGAVPALRSWLCGHTAEPAARRAALQIIPRKSVLLFFEKCLCPFGSRFGGVAEPDVLQAVLQIQREHVFIECLNPFGSRCGGAAEPAVLQAALQIFHGPHGTHTRRSGCTEGQGALGGQPVCRRA